MHSRTVCRLLLTLVLLTWGHGAVAKTVLPFLVPSSVTGDATRLFHTLTQDFQAQRPDIAIVLKTFASYESLMDHVLAETRAGRDVGLFVAEVSTTSELRAAKAILPFRDAFGDGLPAFRARFVPSFLGNSYSSDGTFWSAPYFRGMPIAYYNLAELAKIGVGAQALPTDWAGFEALLVRLREVTHRPPFVLGGDWYDWLFEALAAGTEAPLGFDDNGVVIDTPGAIEALALLKRLKDQGLMIRTPVWKATINGFAENIFPVVFYSNGGMRMVQDTAGFPWATEQLPRLSRRGVPAGGGNLFLSAAMGEEQRQAAVAFLDFLLSPTHQASLSAATGYFPVVRAAFEDPRLRRLTEQDSYAGVYRNLEHVTAKLMAPNSSAVRLAVKGAIDRCLDHNIAPDVALHEAQASLTAKRP